MKKKLFALALIAVFAFAMCACGGANTETSEETGLAGEYQDEVSQRATLSLTESEDGSAYDATILWSNSAEEMFQWDFTGAFDGEKIEYTDGICKVITDIEGGFSERPREGEYSGTLTLGDDGKLTWAGSNEDETAVFVKIPSE